MTHKVRKAILKAIDHAGVMGQYLDLFCDGGLDFAALRLRVGSAKPGAAVIMERKRLRDALAFALTVMAILVSMAALTGSAGHAQGSGCALLPDDRNPTEKILRCPNGLMIRTAPGTRYQLIDQGGRRRPDAAWLTDGALLIDLDSAGGAKTFQILTPDVIASVRGTRWAMEVTPKQTSTFVIAGAVVVARPEEKSGVVLGPGQGVDAATGQGPLTVRRWSAARVKALLARFGQ